MPGQSAGDVIDRIKGGDRQAREEFLEENKQLVHQIACRFCGKPLEWGRDDELAVAFMAFNEALDRYRRETGVPFEAFARKVISSRLSDYFRRQKKDGAVFSLQDLADTGDGWELSFAVCAVQEEMAARERAEEIREFNQLLGSSGITFEDLVKCSPKRPKTRQQLVQAAFFLAGNKDLLQAVKEGGRLPLAILEEKSGAPRKALERGRKYVIALSLLIAGREDFPWLYSYLRPLLNKGAS